MIRKIIFILLLVITPTIFPIFESMELDDSERKIYDTVQLKLSDIYAKLAEYELDDPKEAYEAYFVDFDGCEELEKKLKNTSIKIEELVGHIRSATFLLETIAVGKKAGIKNAEIAQLLKDRYGCDRIMIGLLGSNFSVDTFLRNCKLLQADGLY